MKKLISITFMIAVFATMAFSQNLKQAVSGNWKLIKQSKRENWSLYNRAFNDSKFLEFRVVGPVNALPESVFNTAQKQLIVNENLPKGMNQTIIEQSDDGFLTYYEAKMPLMFKDRDLALQYNLYKDTSRNSYAIDWVEVPEKAPVLKKGFIRIVSTRGKWEFTPYNNSNTLVTFTQHADMGGNIPAWIVNKMSGKTLVGDLLKLREMIAKTDNQ